MSSQFDNHTIERCPHDSENPYTMVRNDLIRDASISPNCRWLIMYLLANKDGWTIKMSEVMNHVKLHMGRDKVKALFNEAIEHGYIKRVILKRANPRGGMLNTYHYIVSELPKFKKCYRWTENQETGDQETGQASTKEGTSFSQEKPSQEEAALKPPKEKEPLFKAAAACEKTQEEPVPLVAAAAKEKDFSSSSFKDSSDIEVTKTNGNKLTLSQSDIYKHFINFPEYDTATISEAIQILRQDCNNINSPLKVLQSICLRLTKTKNESISKSPIIEKKLNENEERSYVVPESNPGERITMAEYHAQQMAKKCSTPTDLT